MQNAVANFCLCPPPACETKISGTVKCSTNGQDTPIAGATIKVVDRSYHVVATRTTSDDGTYTVEGLPAGGYTVKLIVPSGYQACSNTCVPLCLACNQPKTVNFCACAYCPPAKVSGIVKCASNGKTISRVAVKIYDSNNNLKGSTTTGCDGRYSFRNLPAGNYTIKITVPCGYEACDDTSVSVILGCGQCKTVDFCVCPACKPAKVTGTVKCSSTSQAIAGVTVEAYDSNNALKGSATTDTDGQYSIGNLPAGTYTIKITVPDGSEACAGTSTTVTLTCGQCKVVNFCVCKSTPSTGTEGCTPGYWKNHTCKWPAPYRPTSSFNDTFGVAAFDSDITLLAAARQGGGGINALGRHAVAALLNAASTAVDFGMTPDQVIEAVQAALASGGDIEGTKNLLADLNERNCPLGR